MDGAVPGCPRLSFGVVDVRDVADLHLRAMTNPAAKGERFLAIAGDFMTMQQIAQTLKTRMGDAAKKVPIRVLPDFMLRLASIFDSSLKQIIPNSANSKTPPTKKPAESSAGPRDRTKTPSSRRPKVWSTCIC